jgi:hypothetical protein
MIRIYNSSLGTRRSPFTKRKTQKASQEENTAVADLSQATAVILIT